jgi:hypothetical protein
VRKPAVLRDSAIHCVSENHARFWAAVAAGEVDRSVLGKLLQERNYAQLWKRPGVGIADQDIYACILELLGYYVGLLLAVD